MPRVIESMTKYIIQWGFEYLTIRVWRNEGRVSDKYNNDDILLAVSTYARGISSPDTTKSPPLAKIVEELSKLPRVNAVEVVDQSGNGILIYPEWP